MNDTDIQEKEFYQGKCTRVQVYKSTSVQIANNVSLIPLFHFEHPTVSYKSAKYSTLLKLA